MVDRKTFNSSDSSNSYAHNKEEKYHFNEEFSATPIFTGMRVFYIGDM